MKYTKLGNSDLSVSRICLGCMGFGDPTNGQHSWTIGEPETRDIIKAALEGGFIQCTCKRTPLKKTGGRLKAS